MVTRTNKGIAFDEDGKLIIIESVSPNEKYANITEKVSLQEVNIAEKVGEAEQEEFGDTLADNPYEIDGEDADDGEDEYE